MQPAAWDGRSGPDGQVGDGQVADGQVADGQGWGAPAGPGTAPQPGWGDQAPGFANPAPTWGPPTDGRPSGLDDADERRGIGGTIAAHVVLWAGLAAAVLLGPTVTEPLVRLSVPYWVLYTVGNLLLAVPVIVALVLAGRSAVLRLTGLLGGIVITAVVLQFGFRTRDFPSYPWVLSIATYVLGLATWMVVRRHARWGLALLVVFAGLLLLWNGPAGPQLSAFMLQRGEYNRLLLASWNLVPIVVAGILGLLSSFLRPRPGRSTDGIGAAVVGGVVVVVVLAFGLTFVG